MAERNASGRFKDFSRQREEELVAECRQLQADGTGLFDYLGDVFISDTSRFSISLFSFGWREIEEYQSAILDAYNVTEETIRNMFATVRSLDARAGRSLSAASSIVEEHTKLVGAYTDEISPDGSYGGLSAGSYDRLWDAYYKYGEERIFYELFLDGEGLSSEELLGLKDAYSSDYVDGLIYSHIDELVSSDAYMNILLSGEEVVVPLGPDTVFKYKVTVKSGSEGDAQLKFQLAEDAVHFKEFRSQGILGSYTFDKDGKTTFKNSLGKISVDIDGNPTEVEVVVGDVSIGNKQLKIGGDPVEINGVKYSWDAGLKESDARVKVFYSETVDSQYATHVATIETGVGGEAFRVPAIKGPEGMGFGDRTAKMWEEHPGQSTAAVVAVVAVVIATRGRVAKNFADKGAKMVAEETVERYVIVPILEKVAERALVP